jgi:NADPH2:quinone reductase
MKITKGAGVAAVYDSVGKDTYPDSLKVLRKFGAFISFGQSSGTIENFKLSDLAPKLLYAMRPTLFSFIVDKKELERRARQLFSMIASGKIRIAVNQNFALKDVKLAHKSMESRQTTGQTVLVP